MPNAYVKAIYLGIIAGMRGSSAPAFLSDHLAKNRSPEIENSSMRFMASPKVAGFLKVMAAGEFIADKSSFIPDRITAVPLAFRAISGAVCGVAVCILKRERSDLGAVAGGLAAVASAFACYHLRKKLSENTNLPDALLGLAEDTVVIGIGSGVFRDQVP